MKVLVTGGLGFIGSHLVNKLIEMGDEVTVMDNRIRESGVALISEVPIHSRSCDIDGPFDAVAHLASSQGTQQFYDNPKSVLQNNIQLILDICTNCDHWRPKKLIFASSSEVYGRNPTTPSSELDPLSVPNSSEPRWSYAVTKIAGEFVFKHVSGVPNVCSLRYFNIYGPGAGNDHVIPQLIERIGNPRASLVKIKAADSERAFCHVDDAVAATAKAIHYGGKLPAAMNIGNPVGLISIGALAGRIRYLMGSRVALQLTTQELHSGSPRRRCPNISLATFVLKWHPETSLDVGLAGLIKVWNEETLNVPSM